MFKTKKRTKDILNGNIPEQIIIFTLPIMWSYLLQQLYQIVDSVVLGRFASTAALAAIGSSNSILNVVLNFISGVASGAMICVAKNYGSRNPEKVKNSIKTSMFVSIVLGALLTTLLVVFCKPILIVTGCPSDVFSDSKIYLIIYACGFIPYLIYSVGRNIIIATGDGKKSIMFTIIIAIIKVFLDLLLTGLLKMGIWGVSIATLASYIVCAIVVIYIFKNTADIYQFDIKEIGCDSESLIQIIKIGLPAAIQSMLFALSNLVIQTKINSYGTDTIAAFSAYNSVDNYYWCFENAYGSAMITLVSQNYGNKNQKRVYQYANYGIIINFIISLLIGLIVFFFGRYALMLYSTDQNVLLIGEQMLKAVVLTYPTYDILETLSAVCKGNGDATNSMIMCLIGICLVRILYVSFINFTNSYQILYCYGISWTITSLMYVIYLLISKKYKRTY